MSKSHIKTQIEESKPPIEEIPEFEKPLLEVSLTNPFKKILYWLNEIRKKQTTTFAIKLSIPLIAIPVIIFALWEIGKGLGLPSLIGSSVITPTPAPVVEDLADLTVSKAGVLKIARGKENKYLLNQKDGKVIVLQIPIGSDLTRFQNKQVLVTGEYDKSTSVMIVEDIAEIEFLNETTIIPTVSPTPTTVPSPTVASSSATPTL